MNRRRFLTATVGASTLGVAGCLGGDDESDDGSSDDNGSDANGGDNGTANGEDNGTANGEDNGTANGEDNGEDGGEEPLQADFTIAPESPAPGEQVTFDASDSLGGIVEFRWDFTDDGEIDETTADPVATHTYEEELSTVVTLEVEGSDGETDTRSLELLVTEDDEGGLSAAFDWEPEQPAAGEAVIFTPTRIEGDIAEFRWDFTDDDEFDETTADPTEVTHTFESEGLHPVTLEVEGSDGEVASTTTQVDVSSDDPAVGATYETSPKNPDVDEEVTFNIISEVGDIVEYRWDFTGDGEFDLLKDRGETVTYTYEEPGTYLSQLVVEDSDGNIGSTLGPIEVGE